MKFKKILKLYPPWGEKYGFEKGGGGNMIGNVIYRPLCLDQQNLLIFKGNKITSTWNLFWDFEEVTQNYRVDATFRTWSRIWSQPENRPASQPC